MRPTDQTRRKFLAGTAAAAALGIAGCSTADSSGATSSETETRTANETATATPEETDTSTETEEPGAVETSYRSRERYARPGESFDDFEDISRWTAFSGKLTAGSTSFVGSQSAKLVGKDGNSAVMERAADSKDMSETELSMAVRTTTPDKIAVNVRLVDPFGNELIRSLRRISHDSENVSWFRTAPGTFRSSGEAFDITQIERIQVQMLNATETEARLNVDDMRLHPKPDTGYIVLGWDDNRQNYYDEAAPINDQFGFPVSMATAPRLVGGENFMSVGQLEERQAAGDDIVAHASVSLGFNEMSEDQLREKLRQNKKWLTNQGFDGADSIVYPGNNYNASVLSVGSEFHYLGGMNQSGNVNTTGVHSFDPMVLPRTIANDLPIAKRVVDNVAQFHECGILNFHDFTLDNTMGAAEYEELLTYIDKKGDEVEVITLDELWELRKEATHPNSSE